MRRGPVSWEFVKSRCVRHGDCLVWMGARTSLGYGHLRDHDQNKYVHRLAYEFNVGSIPDGLLVDHACRNPSCCEPSHLRLATAK